MTGNQPHENIPLRPRQEKLLADLRASIAGGARAPLAVAPCGFGKTVVAKGMIQSAHGRGNSSLFIAPRRELVKQTREKLDRELIPHGVLMAGHRPSRGLLTQVGTVQTIDRRLESGADLPDAKLLLVDEAHLFITPSAKRIATVYQDAFFVGLTATPCRSDGKGLGEVFDDLVLGPSVAELIAEGSLVRPRYFAGDAPDFSGVKITKGDYDERQQSEIFDQKPLIGDVLQNWFELASDRKTIVFAVDVQHSRHLCEQFQDAGIKAAHIDAKTPSYERDQIMRAAEFGDLQVICNCEVFSYGIDWPACSAVVLAFKTKSIAKYFQTVGRGVRTYPGKEDCLILDHGGNVAELGFFEDEVEWSLDGRTSNDDYIRQRQKREPRPIDCGNCGVSFKGSASCPDCGHMNTDKRKRAVDAWEAELAEINAATRQKATKKAEPTKADKQLFYSEILSIQQSRGYKPGWVKAQYKNRFGVWPKGLADIPTDPSPKTLNWVKSRMIAYANSADKRRAA